ncbi:transgelin [Elysia marginata]|uniref:Transgelin n=1 Tax=Elysia marginata TaxID=1093978 RepID=A0AAV4GIT5_9GAST|nr:transgelin [Elysia marginata]
MANRPKGFGMTREIGMKIQNKYDPNLEHEARSWMEAVLEEPIGGGSGMDNFHAVLKDGTILCRLVNKIKPDSVKKINASKMPFHQMENIGKFLSACEDMGIHKHDMFQTADLFDKTNMPQVVNGIFALGRKAPKVGYTGPTLGPKESDFAPREFTEEMLNAGQSVIGLQMGSNKGASQAGMNFGKTRSIND